MRAPQFVQSFGAGGLSRAKRKQIPFCLVLFCFSFFSFVILEVKNLKCLAGIGDSRRTLLTLNQKRRRIRNLGMVLAGPIPFVIYSLDQNGMSTIFLISSNIGAIRCAAWAVYLNVFVNLLRAEMVFQVEVRLIKRENYTWHVLFGSGRTESSIRVAKIVL